MQRLKYTACGNSSVAAADLFCLKLTDVLQDAVKDTTGAGDAFIGAMQYAICKGLQPEQALKLAGVVAACKCTAVGARAGLPVRDAIAEHLL